MKIFGNLRGDCFHQMASNSDIEWISLSHSGLIERFRYAVLICVDSEREIGTHFLKGQDQTVLKGAFDVGNALALERDGFIRLMETQFLNGYDEVWFLEKRPDERASSLYVPQLHVLFEYEYDPVPPPPFIETYELMMQEQAFLGLRDAIKLEYITYDAGLAAQIDKIYGEPVPMQGPPNSTISVDNGTRPNRNRNGKIRDYGPDGWPKQDLDFGHDHGSGDPHIHRWGRPPEGGQPEKPNRGDGEPL
jgi:hypothetical protein